MGWRELAAIQEELGSAPDWSDPDDPVTAERNGALRSELAALTHEAQALRTAVVGKVSILLGREADGLASLAQRAVLAEERQVIRTGLLTVDAVLQGQPDTLATDPFLVTAAAQEAWDVIVKIRDAALVARGAYTELSQVTAQGHAGLPAYNATTVGRVGGQLLAWGVRFREQAERLSS